MQLAREGRVTELPGIGKTLEEKITRSTRPATSRRRELRDKFPQRADLGHAPAGLRAQARAAALRRARDRLARGAARGRRGQEHPRAARLRREGRGEAAARRSPTSPTDGRPGAAHPALARAADRRADRRRAARAPGRRAGRGGRLAAAAGRLGQGPRHHRHRRGPGGAGRGARASCRLVESVAVDRRRRRARHARTRA